MNKEGAFIFGQGPPAPNGTPPTQEHFVLFNHGVIFQPPVQLLRSPIRDFFSQAALTAPDLKLKVIRRNEPPFFAGLDSPDPSLPKENLNGCVFACPTALWPPLRGFLENAAVIVPPRPGINDEPQVIRFLFEPIDMALALVPGQLDIVTVYTLSVLAPNKMVRMKARDLKIAGEIAATLTYEDRQPTREEEETHQRIIRSWLEQKAETQVKEEESRENPDTLAADRRS